LLNSAAVSPRAAKRRSLSLARRLLPLALLALVAPAAASASVPARPDLASQNLSASLADAGGLASLAPREESDFRLFAGFSLLPKTRVRGFEVPAGPRVGEESGLTPRARPGWDEPCREIASGIRLGLELDTDLGWYYARNRWYDPETGIFASTDPLGYPDSANAYAWGVAGPWGRDPMGLELTEGAARQRRQLREAVATYRQSKPGQTVTTTAAGELNPWILTSPTSPPLPEAAYRSYRLDSVDVPGGNPEILAQLESQYASFDAAWGQVTLSERDNVYFDAPSGQFQVFKLREFERQQGLQGLAGAGIDLLAAAAAMPRGSSTSVQARRAPAGGARVPAAKFTYDAGIRRYRNAQTGQLVAQRNLPYPTNGGFASSARQTLSPGLLVDRYGRPTGRVAGVPGASISERGLPPGSENLEYHQYEVLKPFAADVGPAAAVREFGAAGGKTQYAFDVPIGELIRQGYLREKP